MTKEEAIQYLVRRRTYSNYGSTFSEALDIAIESLSADSVRTEAYRDLYEKYIDLKHKTEWIPCSERLPNVGQDVLFCDDKFTQEGYLMKDGNWLQFRWSTVQGKRKVTAWMPLPKPYGERREQCD